MTILEEGKTYNLTPKRGAGSMLSGWVRVRERTKTEITITLKLERCMPQVRTGPIGTIEDVLNEIFHITEH